MRIFTVLVSMTIAIRRFRISSSISSSSKASHTFHFRTFWKHAKSFQTYPSLPPTLRGNRGVMFPKNRNKPQTVNSMTGVVSRRLGNDENLPLNKSKPSAKLIPSTELKKCGERLRQGGLVAFPTETVYGLGCNALDPSAIIKVFEAKERPLTDPLITHVSESHDAFNLWAADIDSVEGIALCSLLKKFWPGPLTLVAKAAPGVPPLLMANTGFCACRCPQHNISLALIKSAKVPIAAPSANKFGHVSPTTSTHVWYDLKYEDIWIVEEEHEEESNMTSCCEVGVESSVAKIEMCNDSKNGQISLLRQGAISLQDIKECLEESGLAMNFELFTSTKKATNETVSNVAPGQTIRHYSPDIPSFILSRSIFDSGIPSASSESDLEFLSKSVLIDFGGRIKEWKHLALAYRDLSETGNSAEATKQVFETLRWAEKVQDADQILFPEISDEIDQQNAREFESSLFYMHSPDALTLALKDRLTRAASGTVIDCLGS